MSIGKVTALVAGLVSVLPLSSKAEVAGWPSHANELIQLIDDPKDRLRARVSGFFERDETAKIAAMFPSLDRHLLDDEEWIYLGAFARLQSGGWQETVGAVKNLLGQLPSWSVAQVKSPVTLCI